jgi:hypothetical protein
VVIASDKGPGIPNVSKAMQDGFSTSGNLGLGLPGVKRLMDDFQIESTVDKGTVVTAKNGAEPADARLGSAERPDPCGRRRADRQASLKAFFAAIGPEACARIRHAAFDMFEAARRQSASGCRTRRWSPTLPRATAHVEGLRGAENASARECWCAAGARQARAPPRCKRRRAYRRPLTLDCIAAMRHVADVVIRPLQGTVQEHQPLQKVRSTPHQVMRTFSFAFQTILTPDV